MNGQMTWRWAAIGVFLGLFASLSEAGAQEEPLVATIELTTSPNPSTFGEPVLLNVVVGGASETPTGSVILRDEMTTLASDALDDSGEVSFSIPDLHAGTYSFFVEYGGDGVYASGEESLVHVIDKAPTITLLTSSAMLASPWEEVTLTVTVQSEVRGVDGEVELYDGPTAVGKANVVDHMAKLSVGRLPLGEYAFSARYSGNDDFAASTSEIWPLRVTDDDDEDCCWNWDAGVRPADDGGSDKDSGASDADSRSDPTGCGCRVVATGRSRPGAALWVIAGVLALSARRHR